jgi:Tol biopolymer transport system component
MERRYSLQEEEARRRGLTTITRLTYDNPGQRGEGLTPRFLRDGSGVVYHRANPVEGPAFMLLDLATGKRRVLGELHGAEGATPTPDGRALIFQRTNFQALSRRISGYPHLVWDDLYRLDLDSGDVQELTRGQRAHEPDVSPDGKWVAYTVAGDDVRQLAICPATGGPLKILTVDQPGLAYTPAWSPDGRRIAYSRWKRGGFRDIHVFDVAAGTDRALWVDRAMDLDPRFSPDGRYLLFSSDRTGIYNVFALDLQTQRLYQVTNVLGGAFQPAVAPDGSSLVFTGFTSQGFDLFSAPYQPATWLEAQPYANARPDADPTLAGESDSPDATAADVQAAVDATVQQVVPYHPWKYMYPRTWEISFPSDPLGLGVSLGINTTVSDPVGNHLVGINVLMPRDGDGSLRLDYSYSGLWPSLGLTVTRTSLMTGGLIVDHVNHAYRQHSASLSGGMGLPIMRKPDSSADLSFGYQYQAYGPADPMPVADPTAGISSAPETGPLAGAYVAWSFSNAHSWSYSVSPQEGRHLQLTLGVSAPSLGSKFTTTQLSWAWGEYLTPPWAKLHAVALLYSGGVGIGDKRSGFGIGGFAEQDLIRSVFLNRHQCCQFLRGYKPGSFVGDQYHLFSAEYRSPLLWVERGYGTFPVYLRRLHGAIYADAGNAFLGKFRPQDLKYGVGAEIRLETHLAYYLYTQVQLGVAKGLSTGGSTQYYFVTAFPF